MGSGLVLNPNHSARTSQNRFGCQVGRRAQHQLSSVAAQVHDINGHLIYIYMSQTCSATAESLRWLLNTASGGYSSKEGYVETFETASSCQANNLRSVPLSGGQGQFQRL